MRKNMLMGEIQHQGQRSTQVSTSPPFSRFPVSWRAHHFLHNIGLCDVGQPWRVLAHVGLSCGTFVSVFGLGILVFACTLGFMRDPYLGDPEHSLATGIP